ncbi:MAG: UDP-N-acetylmuramoyl-L-alanine--D-glutamate ligase [Patescibacteria group bacterium]
MLISQLKGKKILILGFGREGQDSFLFLRKHFPEKNLGIADKKEFEEFPTETQRMLNQDSKVVLYFGSSYLKQANKYDVIIKSPGIPPHILKPYLKKQQILTSQTNIFFANCPGKIVGVTGTKGKSTTASLISKVLKIGGVKAHLIGNIEKPVLQFLDDATKDDVFVYELSSFQLETANQSPHIAIFLNLYPEHLDRHGTFKAYETAKANITKFQAENDYLIFNETDKEVKLIALKSKAKQIPFAPKREKNALYAAAPQPVFLVAKLFNISKEKVQKVIESFKPLPHRLELVGTHRGITFYNDSLATIPEATIAALDMLGNKVATLLVGGYDRGIKFKALAERILQSKVQNLILLPTTGELVFKELEDLHAKQKNGQLPKLFRVQSMAEAVELAYQHTPRDSICLLSPAASSFNMFRDYKERGDEFKNFVNRYAKKART